MLEVDGLTKRYGTTLALSDLSFSVRPGEMYGFVGANGAGKTTAMRIMLGVLAADSGEVRWRGRPVTFETRRRFGYMPEERGLYPKMRVTEHLVYLARLHGLDRAAADRSADELTERLGVAERRGDAIEKLSLGNQQRVQLAAALVHDPEVLVLDEPFSGLDPVGVDALAGVLLEQRRAGRAGRVLLPPARPRRAAVRLGRDHQRRPDGRHRHGRRPAGREGRRQLLVDRAPDAAARLGRRAARASRSCPSAAASWCWSSPTDADDQEVLAAASRAGRVEHFSRRQPTLTELFREAVAEPEDMPADGGRAPAGGDGMSDRGAPRGMVPLVLRREITTRVRERSFLISTADHAADRCRRRGRAEPVQLERRRRHGRASSATPPPSQPALQQAARVQGATAHRHPLSRRGRRPGRGVRRRRGRGLRRPDRVARPRTS